MHKSRFLIGSLAMAAALSLQARAGSLSYVAIPATGSDAGSGIDPGATYTSAISGGNTSGTDLTVNGLTLSALVGSGASASASNVTFTATSGNLANTRGGGSNIAADGVLLTVLGSAAFVHGADPNSGPTITLDPASLTQGTTYDLRLYIGAWSGQQRMVNLTFSGDGQAPISTDVFNEDDATTSAGGFATANQTYYIDYQFTWDGQTTPTISIAQQDTHVPFHLYALTNQTVGANTPAPAQTAATGYVAAAPVADNDIGSVSSDTFYTPLQSQGDWVSVQGYGNCFRPGGVSADWRPYTNGYWANTDCGWTWVSNDRFGWATDHYGRWTSIDGEGWVWVPGRVWAPAWVSWRYGGGSVGWAPLPPAARFDPGIGISIWADHSYDIGPSYYSFVAVGRLGSPNLSSVIYPASQNTTYINNTKNITNITYNTHNSTVYNGGPSLAAVNTAIKASGGTPIRTLVLKRQPTPAAAGGTFSKVQGNQPSLVAPAVIPKTKATVSPKNARTIAAPKIDHGWNKVGDPKAVAQLRAKIASQTKGVTPQNTHAKLPAGIAATPAVKSNVKTAAVPGRGVTPAVAPAHTPVVVKGKHSPTPAPAVRDQAVTNAAAEITPAVKKANKPALENFEHAATPAPVAHHAITPVPEANKKPELENFEHKATPAVEAEHTPKEEKAAKEHATPRPEGAVKEETAAKPAVAVKPAVVHPTPKTDKKNEEDKDKKDAQEDR